MPAAPQIAITATTRNIGVAAAQSELTGISTGGVSARLEDAQLGVVKERQQQNGELRKDGARDESVTKPALEPNKKRTKLKRFLLKDGNVRSAIGGVPA